MAERRLHYKDFDGSVEYSEIDKVYYGKILNIKDLISYEGKNVKELEANFRESVDIYLEVENVDQT